MAQHSTIFLSRTTQHKTCIVCTGVVWLYNIMLGANVPVCKLTTWGIHNMYKKHKTHPEAEIIRCPSSSPVFA